MKYDFIDIGCGQCSVSSDDYFYGTSVKGLLVEPIEEYCAILPQSDTVLVECAGIGEYDGEKELTVCLDGDIVEYVPHKLYKNKKALDRYMKSKNIFHSGTSSFIGADKIHHKDTYHTRIVKLMSLETLLKKYNISEVDQLKIDVEGYEPIILKQLVNLWENKKFKVNKKLIFECAPNFNNNEILIKFANEIGVKFGFKWDMVSDIWDEDIVMEKI